jgi:hypothetical protein
MEQKIRTTTVIKLDLIDSLKCLFGRTIKVTTDIYIPQENEINSFNSYGSIEIVPTTSYFRKQDKPNFGYSPIDDKN